MPELKSIDDLRSQAHNFVKTNRKPRAALVVPSNKNSLTAFVKAANEKLIDPIIIGDEKLLLEKSKAYGLNIDGINLIDLHQPDMALEASLKMAEANEIDMIVIGRIELSQVLEIILSDDSGFVSKRKIISHIAALKTELYPKLLLLADSFISPKPDLKGKIAQVENAIKLAHKLGYDNPRVALLAAVEVVYPQMPVTLDAAVIAKMSDRNQIKNALVDGPLSFDVALDMDAAIGKGITNSEVAGRADILIAPNIETANGIYKAMELYSQTDIGGIIFGGRIPLSMNPPMASTENRYISILMAVLSSSVK